uniref:Protein neuralized (inferred by orthology to a D. melanogaster protein) n=1 Tax=Strongyloides venezuelensis TaxID=75913 RepID=A0A0K0FPX7_STRVS
MGLGHSSVSNPDVYSLNEFVNRGTPNNPKIQLKFHTVRGSNLELSHDNRVATRHTSYNNGVAFTNRPIEIGEHVVFRIRETTSAWSGVLRLGATVHNPSTEFRHNPVPEYTCPNLTEQEGYWAKSISSRLCRPNTVFHIICNENHEIIYGINFQEYSTFFRFPPEATRLWLMIDIYGETTSIEFLINSDAQELRRTLQDSTDSSFEDARSDSPIEGNMNDSRNQTPDNIFSSRIDYHYGSEYLAQLSNEDQRFHTTTGVNVLLSNNGQVVTYDNSGGRNTYVFTCRPIKPNERIKLLVKDIRTNSRGPFIIGVTVKKPNEIDPNDLPNNPSSLEDREEYYQYFEIRSMLANKYDSLSFYYTESGRLFYCLQDTDDTEVGQILTLPLIYLFMKLEGPIASLRMVGYESIRERSSSLPSISDYNPREYIHSIEPSEYVRNLLNRINEGSPRNSLRISQNNRENYLSSRLSASPSSVGNRRNISYTPPYSIHTPDPITSETPILNAYNNNIQSSSVSPRTETTFGSSTQNPIVTRVLNGRTVSDLLESSNSLERRVNTILSEADETLARYRAYRTTTTGDAEIEEVDEESGNEESISEEDNENMAEPINEADTCTICIERIKNISCYPCGHLCMCKRCSKQFKGPGKACPICRGNIVDLVRIFR